MQEISKQLMSLWQKMQKSQKEVVLALLVISLLGVVFLFFKSSSPRYIPLLNGQCLSISEMENIEACLMARDISYKIDRQKGILVKADDLEIAQTSLNEIQKPKGTKGFELFDTNTWIKGEKELQVLEMRALKGQLEKDLAAFENIKNAHVILDIPPQRAFHSTKFQTKASVILTLMPKAHLSASQLRAITNHLSGAIRGLEPQMIAISDSTGKLYQAIDSDRKENTFQDLDTVIEEKAKEKISALLERLVGKDHFHVTVQVLLNKEATDVASLSIRVLIDDHAVPSHRISLRQEIERQVRGIAKGYGAVEEPNIDFASFEGKHKIQQTEQTKKNWLGILMTGLFLGGALIALFPFLTQTRKRKQEDPNLFKTMTRIDLKHLADSMEKEDPQTIAVMLSYLEPAKAEKLMSAFKQEVQEEILFYLMQIEKGTPS